MIPRRQNDNNGGAYGPMGREMRGGLPEKEIKVSKYGRRHQQQRVECMGFPCGFRCRGLPAQSTWRAMTTLGIKGKGRIAGIQRLSTTA